MVAQTQEIKPNLCPICFLPIIFSESDRKYNTIRALDQASFRKKDEVFRIKFRGTCSNCGTVYLDKTIKNVKVNK